MTRGELIEDFMEVVAFYLKAPQEIFVEQKNEHVYGIDGLARILGCSKSHASKLKGKGIFDKAIVQNGRKIIIDKEKALELFNKKDY